MIDGLRRIPLRRFEDERGWFVELMRASGLPKPVQQSNLSYSRAGVIRGLHYHERGQDDLFACVQGTVRVVVLDRATGETFTEDIGDENFAAVLELCLRNKHDRHKARRHQKDAHDQRG